MFGASPFTLIRRQKAKKEEKKPEPKANFLDMLEQ